MTVHLVTFSDESMDRSRRICATSALRFGADEDWQYEQRFMDASGYAQQNPQLFQQPEDSRRAWAWWAWKPVIIEDAMRRAVECFDGKEQYVVYADAGIEFIDNVSHILDRMDQDIFLFGNNWPHYAWCKRDIVEAIMPGTPWETFGKQVQASVIFFRVSDDSRKFVAEWLRWCLASTIEYATLKNEDGLTVKRYPLNINYLIDDSPSRAPNHPEFRENRHDQAILTTLAYREGIKLHYWPASYNDGAFNYEKIAEYAGDNYPILFNHHRRRNHEWAGVSIDNLTNSLRNFQDAIEKASSA